MQVVRAVPAPLVRFLRSPVHYPHHPFPLSHEDRNTQPPPVSRVLCQMDSKIVLRKWKVEPAQRNCILIYRCVITECKLICCQPMPLCSLPLAGTTTVSCLNSWQIVSASETVIKCWLVWNKSIFLLTEERCKKPTCIYWLTRLSGGLAVFWVAILLSIFFHPLILLQHLYWSSLGTPCQ